ncbi:MAG: ISAs1 family transposase [Ignavibacteria bacterium]|nr:ISAs1 family transposase [Ignavibacteria bacterium]
MTVQNLCETSIMLSFSNLPDPRKNRNQIYSLFDIITVAILGVLCGADDWVEISFWGEANLGWLRERGLCLNGIPSHDTFSRFFRFIDSKAFEKCFINWTQKICKVIGGVIALDGKTIRNSGSGEEKAIHLVSAFSVENDLILGQLATEAKSNEITAFPFLIEMLDLKEATVTIDAAGCQKEIASQIRDKGGDYVLALKGNQGHLHAEVENFFTQALLVSPEEACCDQYTNQEKSRGRLETREVWISNQLDWLPQKEQWKDLRSIVCLKNTRVVKDKKTVELRYYISSLQGDAWKIGYAIRSHWSVENQLHWQLDVSYGEDDCKIRKDNGPENFSVIRRATLNLLKEDKKTKAGIKNKRSKAGWDKNYMFSILGINC